MNLALASTFLSSHKSCVVATVGPDATPEAATVGFFHDEQFVVLIGTSNQSRKYQNITANPAVAMVVGFEGHETVQLEGVATEASRDHVADRLAIYFKKVPMARKFADDPNQRWFLITPTWLRHTNFDLDTPIFETKDFS